MSFLSKKFDDIPSDRRVETDKFLACCEEIVKFFDDMGTVFKPVKNDVEGNIAKIKKRLLENPGKFGTLEDIIDTELAETDKKYKVGKKAEGIATNALMWLQRGLCYIFLFFDHLLKEDYVDDDHPKNLLKNCALMAYNESLKKYHGAFVGGVFSVAMKAAPYRDKFMQKIAGRNDNEEDEKTLQTIREFNVNFEKNIKYIEALFIEKEIDQNYKV